MRKRYVLARTQWRILDHKISGFHTLTCCLSFMRASTKSEVIRFWSACVIKVLFYLDMQIQGPTIVLETNKTTPTIWRNLKHRSHFYPSESQFYWSLTLWVEHLYCLSIFTLSYPPLTSSTLLFPISFLYRWVIAEIEGRSEFIRTFWCGYSALQTPKFEWDLPVRIDMHLRTSQGDIVRFALKELILQTKVGCSSQVAF
jgi:hypothetical protein